MTNETNPDPIRKDDLRHSDRPAVTSAPVAPAVPAVEFVPAALVFQPPVEVIAPRPARSGESSPAAESSLGQEKLGQDKSGQGASENNASSDSDDDSGSRRRRRGGRSRSRRSNADNDGADNASQGEEEPLEDSGEADAESGQDSEDSQSGTGTRRRRRRRRAGSDGDDSNPSPDDPPQTVVKVRQPRRRTPASGDVGKPSRVTRGSTRLEAKRQRRRDGREFTRRRSTIISEAEFLARRESVERVMVVRQVEDRTQIGVLEDGILVEHYVNRHSATSFVGNVYLGSVQNVLPSMEAAFVDIGKARNAVLYAGEVNWDAAGLEGQPKRIEQALKSGEPVMVQVTKDPIGHKGARLTSQVSLPGRFLVYVPQGEMTGISRKLPDRERARLKSILRQIVPEGAGVIVRTAAEGASEEELQRDISRLTHQWEQICSKARGVQAPALLHSEPDLTTRVIRDVFNEDFSQLVVSGEKAWSDVAPYVEKVAPDLRERVTQWEGEGDIFAHYRVDEQLAKALDRTINLPSGGSLVIDRTEAMVVIDVNTGRFTGRGGNLEETVTKNNLEAAEEIVRQMRLRDLGGIIVVDFIDMVLESNREMLLRRLLECLGRDRTKHQVAEVTSLGLVQMTRKRVGQGLLEAYSQPCAACSGRGVIVNADLHGHPVPVAHRDAPVEKTPAKPAASAPATTAAVSAKVVHSGLPPEVLAKMPTPRSRGKKAKGSPAQMDHDAEVVQESVDLQVEEVTLGTTVEEITAVEGESAGNGPATEALNSSVVTELDSPLPAAQAFNAPASPARRRRAASRPAGSVASPTPASPTEGEQAASTPEN